MSQLQKLRRDVEKEFREEWDALNVMFNTTKWELEKACQTLKAVSIKIAEAKEVERLKVYKSLMSRYCELIRPLHESPFLPSSTGITIGYMHYSVM